MVKLKRIGRGLYKTPDNRFQIQRDPTGGDMAGGWGCSSWIMCDTLLSDDYGPMQYKTLRMVRAVIDLKLKVIG